jgi:uncharacterized protein with FMN-binding domain
MQRRAGIRSLFVCGLFLATAFPLSAQNAQTQAPSNATAKCKDGSYSAAKSERGACSRHGGIAQWLGSTQAAAQDEAPTGATARCTDGTYSKSNGKGVCSSHGGVAQLLPATTTPPAAEESQATNDDQVPGNATARCTDGTYSTSNGRGACSSHGGVAERLPAGTPQSSATSQASTNAGQDSSVVTGASARCKDGTYSHSAHRSGTCSRHGGVAEWLRRPVR